MSTVLNIAIWLPLVGAGAIALLPASRGSAARWVAALTSGAVLVLSVVLTVGFSRVPLTTKTPVTVAVPQFATQMPWIPQIGASYFVGLDGLSLPMFLLNALLVFLAVLVSWKVAVRPRAYFALVLVLETAVAGVFSSLDLLLFFLFWEMELAPMYFLIGVWGGERRAYAAMKFILYTVAGSAFMLVGILVLYLNAPIRSFDLTYLGSQSFPIAVQALAWLLLFVGFAVKTPIVPFHTWLPDAHTEAPTAISVLLAGVLLKMGAYGLIRMNIGLLPEATQYLQLGSMLAILGAINILYGALVAMMQTDLKRVIANSSVSHMGYVVLGASAMTPLGIEGAVFQMFSHGTITGLLFIMVGLVYDRTHTRNIADLQGLAPRMPFIAWAFVIASLASLGLPGMSGFVAEFLVFMGALPVWGVETSIAIFTIAITAGYMLYLLERVFFRAPIPKWAHLGDANRLEMATVSVLIAVIVAVGLVPSLLADVINPGVGPIMAKYVSG